MTMGAKSSALTSATDPPRARILSRRFFTPSSSAFATVVDYGPHPGDSCHANDWDKARTVSRYVVSDGTATLIARTWTRYVRGVAANGWPTIVETTFRACSQSAAIDDPGNAVSTVVRYDDESSLVPYLLRGETVSETDEDGVTETHSHTILSNSVVCTVVTRTKGAHEAKTREVKERDLAYGLALYEATQLTADPSVEFGWRRHVYDSRHRLRFTQYDDGSSETNAYDCCRLLFRIDRNGAKTLYCSTPETAHLYHAEEEVSMAALPPGADFTMPGLGYEGMSGRSAFRVTQHFADAFGRETNTVSFASTSQKASVDPSFGGLQSRYRTIAATHYPLGLSDVSAMADARGAVTRIENRSCQSYDETVSALFAAEAPDVAVSVTTNRSFRGGGSLAVRAADGKCVAERHVASYAADGTRIECSTTDSSDCGVVTNRVSECDFLGRVVRVKSPTSDVVRSYDGASPRELSSHDLVSGVAATNVYDDVGDLAGVDSCGVSSRSVVSYECVSGGWWRVEAEIAFASGVTNRNEALRTRLTGLSDEVRSETERTDWGERISRTTSSFDRSTSDLVEREESLADGVRESTRRFGYLWRTSGPDGTWLQYLDYFGWVYYVKWVSPNGGAPQRRMWYERNSLGDIVEEDTFWANTTGSVRTRTFSYDSLGNRVSEENEVGDVVMRGFDSAGRVVSEDGDAYPLRVGYDSAGRRTSLRTTRDAENWDETGWAFDAPTGLCTSKTFADGSAVTNTWTADGLPLRKIAPDGSWTENVYDSSRRKVGQASGDPSCVFALSLDAFGRTVAASNAVAGYVYSLANQGVATNETATVADLSLDISRAVDSCGRVVSIARGGVRDEIAYCPSNGVMAAISNDEVSVAYSYSDDLLDTGYAISVAGGETFCRAVSRHDHVGDMVLSVTNSTPVATNGWHYYHDNCRRPVSRNADAFAYNSRGEVTNATIAANASAYAYDGIGNLSESSVATGGLPAVATSYYVNSLNQYESIWSADDDAWLEYSENGEVTRFGDRGFLYDAKSRLVCAGVWVFDEERYYAGDFTDYDELYSFELVVSNRYDYLDRRVQKITSEATHTYFYDGWMLIKEIVANTNGTIDVIEYHWGKDLSGTIGGAGGVGGLLYLKRNGAIYVPWYDAYGNVMGYWDAQGNVVAQYTYDAFGKLISSSGPMADVFAIRYSTKYFDVETGFYYYGYRFYSPELMRWITRDPIGEEGGVNLYAMCENNSVAQFDVFGLYELTLISDNTVESDVLMWYLHGNVGNVIRSNIRSREHLLDVIRRENARHGSLVTVLNLSGHGLASGSGVSFVNGAGFDVGESYNVMKPLLARGATIRIWSCEAASTYRKCSNLKTAAEALDVTIFANTGDVAAGPDGGTFGRLVRGVVAWIVGEKEGEWMRFVPHPKIQSKGWTIGPRVFKIQKRERRAND